MTITPEVPYRLVYCPEKFVNREEALELVLQKARQILLGAWEERRVILFYGQRGSGKSWLLEEIRRQAATEVFSCCFHVLSGAFDVSAIREETAAQSRPLLLLLDVDDVQGSQLDDLATRVLAPLVREQDVLVVLAQRGKPHYWVIPEFREKSIEHDLAPFEREHIHRQVQVQVEDSAADMIEIEQLGGGYPWSTYLLARHLPDRLEALGKCAAVFLDSIDVALREQFGALSVLRAFDEERMEPLLSRHPATLATEKWSYKACRDLRKRMGQTRLIRWSSERRGYVIDQPLRLVLEALLLAQDPELWRILHGAAYELYDQWIHEHPQPGEWWAAEREHHGWCLANGRMAPLSSPNAQDPREGRGDD